MMIISLIGPMGAGKSTVGPLLAARLNYAFIDIDHWIEQAHGLSVSEIFAAQGEASFRDMESQALAALLQKQNLILATGGGIITTAKSRAYLQQTHVIYLSVSVASELERLKEDDTRPLLKQTNKETTLTQLQNERAHWYQSLADLTIDTDPLSPLAVVAEIISNHSNFG